MQPLIKKVLRYINTRINKNSKFLIIQKKTTCIHWNGYLSCRFQITVKAISYNDIKCTNKYLILDDPLFTKSIPLSVLFMILHLDMYYLLMLAPVENMIDIYFAGTRRFWLQFECHSNEIERFVYIRMSRCFLLHDFISRLCLRIILSLTMKTHFCQNDRHEFKFRVVSC